MEQAFIFDEHEQRIGTLTVGAYPYGKVEEKRQGVFFTIPRKESGVGFATNGKQVTNAGGLPSGLVSESVTEFITVVHTVQWEDARQYPDEVALVESYPSNYFEIGKRVNGTWIRAGAISELECRYEEGDEDGFSYPVHWAKAFKHLPACSVRVYRVQE
jgi:hypothetical protein